MRHWLDASLLQRQDRARFGSYRAHPHKSRFQAASWHFATPTRNTNARAQVNHSPSFTCDSPLDLAIKEELISTALELVGGGRGDKVLAMRGDGGGSNRKSSTVRRNSEAGVAGVHVRGVVVIQGACTGRGGVQRHLGHRQWDARG